MESTGVYGKPVWNVLEKTLQLVLANPYQIKNIPSQKTDRRDSVWIADLLAHGLIKPSFVPPPAIRQLRDLTRLRVQVTGEPTRVHNRIHKVLEDANSKLDSVLSDLLGVSGRGMLRGLVQGRTDPGWLADYARGSGRRRDVFVEILLQLVMAVYFIDLAALLAQAQPPAFFQGEVVFHLQPHHRTHPREAIDHNGGEGAVTQATTCEVLMELRKALVSSDDITVAAPLMTEWRGPRTACAGLAGITWPVTSQSNSIRMQARCCLTVGAERTRPSSLI